VVKSISSSPARLTVLLVVALALVVSACSSNKVSGSGSAVGDTNTSGGASSSASGAPSTAASSAKPSEAPAQPVHIRLLSSDGNTYGVGMPVIAYFSKRISSGKALQQATKATVNGKPIAGAWYFETSAAGKGPIEGHFRPQSYWPAHAKIHVDIPAKGLSAGRGLAYDDSLTLDFSTGARHIALVNDASHTITVTSDGVEKYKFPVSLGATKTPTAHGTKIIMEKGRDICMRGPGYYECHVKYTQRLTYGGEYLHAAPWNTRNIHNGVDSSNGCTNMYINDAKTLYGFLRIGDVVSYPNANGPAMSLGAGYGDWNLSWSQWQTGGLVPTT
jgi:lipoprotein-anchoring transpeptidase ErfK/SrfK